MKIIAANWKMNGSVRFAEEFVSKINEVQTNHKVIVFPPAELLGQFQGFRYCLGAQNSAIASSGAITGESSPRILYDVGCRYVLVGHSERRTLFREDDKVVFAKWQEARNAGLIPIVCIGERRRRWDTLQKQLSRLRGQDLSQTIFAYEPVWCIGTGVTPPPEEIDDVLYFIKGLVGKQSPLLYGGSVTAENAKSILSVNNIDGVLVGGASLDIAGFSQIIQASV